MDVYQENGFANRRAYLRSLSERFGVDYHTVADFAATLGANEDFDGLVTTLEDFVNDDQSWEFLDVDAEIEFWRDRGLEF